MAKNKLERTELSTSKVKFLINVGIYSAIYVVFMFIFSLFGLLAPWLMYICEPLGVAASGVVVMLYVAKVRHRGMLTGMGLLCTVFMAFSGHAWFVPLVGLALGLLADGLCFLGKFRSTLLNSLAYAILCLWTLIPWVPIFMSHGKRYTDHLSPEAAAYIASWFGFKAFIIWAAITALAGFIGALAGSHLVKGQLTRAGAV